jgi:hypothetical protein
VNQASDAFTLYDLRVEVVDSTGEMVCDHRIYPLAALIPLLPAKQRETHPNDWMTTDTDIACPDPLCGAIFRITRTGRTTFRHGDVTRVPLRPHPEASG